MSSRRVLTGVGAILCSSIALLAGSFAVYPGASEPDWAEAVRQQATAQGGTQTDSGMRDVKIYATSEPFEKVYAFYKARGTEVPGFSSPSGRPGPRGVTIHVGAFTFDGATSLRASKQFVIITRPVFLDTKLEDMRDVTAIQVTTKK
jgi:hypothetical protein